MDSWLRTWECDSIDNPNKKEPKGSFLFAAAPAAPPLYLRKCFAFPGRFDNDPAAVPPRNHYVA
jgi:hypothetical protein